VAHEGLGEAESPELAGILPKPSLKPDVLAVRLIFLRVSVIFTVPPIASEMGENWVNIPSASVAAPFDAVSFKFEPLFARLRKPSDSVEKV
jgi:hypothetical protein